MGRYTFGFGYQTVVKPSGLDQEYTSIGLNFLNLIAFTIELHMIYIFTIVGLMHEYCLHQLAQCEHPCCCHREVLRLLGIDFN